MQRIKGLRKKGSQDKLKAIMIKKSRLGLTDLNAYY